MLQGDGDQRREAPTAVVARVSRRHYVVATALAALAAVLVLAVGLWRLATADAGAPPAGPGLLDRAFDDPTLDLLRLVLLFVAAFTVGAVVQRVVLGSYAIKIGIREGSVEIADVAVAGGDDLEALETLKDSLADALTKLETRLAALEADRVNRQERAGSP